MSQRTQTPVIKSSDSQMGDKQTHPAYGVIQLSMVCGGSPTLFGSDLGHNQRVCIRISTAHLNRSLNRDWIHADDTLVELEMSHAQFAQFITSSGQGAGTPVTLTRVVTHGDIPAIANLATKHEIHREEIKASTKESLAKMADAVAMLRTKMDEGRLGKKDLQAILHKLECELTNAPENLAYTVKSAEKALEKATSDAKIEVESFVQMTAQRLGLESISQLGLLTKKD